jgi:hypothetical protein
MKIEMSVSRRDLADTLCFLERHERDSERSACDDCEAFAQRMWAALSARALSAEEPDWLPVDLGG